LAKIKVAVSLDARLVDELDALVKRSHFPSRSQGLEVALAEKLERLRRTQLARECAKLDAREEAAFADAGLQEDLRQWPAY
jgi:metal-responsive CopG/Arc/MetJ family transcriptional regulator